MDISDSYEPQHPQQEQPTQQPHQQTQQSEQQMQCDFNPTNGFASNQIAHQAAIPLPAPPSMTVPKVHTQAPPTATDIDIDSLLLQKFSCLGTTDHEDLIIQFQNLMNNQMGKDSARFFLEMSNWNLQTAVGCYLDFCNFQPLPSMKIIEEHRPSEFRQVWRLQNDGNEIWPKGCYLVSPCQMRHIEVPSIKPGETCDIFCDIPSSQPAIMWRISTPNGWYFGDTIWMIPPGSENIKEELRERMTKTKAAELMEHFPQVNIAISTNME